ncbi:hypothetical protein INT43_004079 [Umbelopsis isabellina]|uniref:Uncharacterized protein n=1 Tax=Mortierella isabellina TaxID=91625 RepID=A0A8H7UER8_MORIS|nr:hypothetical protein INT43_004079 [Umbelopsis isabellina]
MRPTSSWSIPEVVGATLLVKTNASLVLIDSMKMADNIIRGEADRRGSIWPSVYHLLGEADAEYGGLKVSSEIMSNGFCSSPLAAK